MLVDGIVGNGIGNGIAVGLESAIELFAEEEEEEQLPPPQYPPTPATTPIKIVAVTHRTIQNDNVRLDSFSFGSCCGSGCHSEPSFSKNAVPTFVFLSAIINTFSTLSNNLLDYLQKYKL